MANEKTIHLLLKYFIYHFYGMFRILGFQSIECFYCVIQPVWPTHMYSHNYIHTHIIQLYTWMLNINNDNNDDKCYLGPEIDFPVLKEKQTSHDYWP